MRSAGFKHFYTARSGQSTYKLLIEHEGSGIVINCGEVRKDSLKKKGLKVGSRVSAGQTIGLVSDTSMLHFETYVLGTTDSHRWWKSKKHPPRELLNRHPAVHTKVTSARIRLNIHVGSHHQEFMVLRTGKGTVAFCGGRSTARTR